MSKLAAIAAIGYALGIALSFVPIWPCSLLEHFRVQYLFAGAVVAGIAYAFARRWFDAALVALLLDLLVVAPDLGAPARAAAGTPVRLLLANVLRSNPHHDRVATLIAETNADVIALVETDQPWFDALAPVLAGYARLEHHRDDNFGLALYARGTITGKVEQLGIDLPTIVADVTLSSGPQFRIVVTHPWPPISRSAEVARDRQLAGVAARARELAAPILVVGDLNTTPWSRAFAELVSALGLCDSRAGFGYQGTYPASSALVRIPIDHVLVSCDVGVRDRSIGSDIGSDHLPVIVELAL